MTPIRRLKAPVGWKHNFILEQSRLVVGCRARFIKPFGFAMVEMKEDIADETDQRIRAKVNESSDQGKILEKWVGLELINSRAKFQVIKHPKNVLQASPALVSWSIS